MAAKYKSYSIGNIHNIPGINVLEDSMIEDIKLVAEIYPFKTNNYVLENLIDWDNFVNDPIFRLNFPAREMLTNEDFEQLRLGRERMSVDEYQQLINDIRVGLNPHPAGQSSFNIPFDNGVKLEGIQHKYKTTVLFFPSHNQTCHAYCTFCFRWPQFVSGLNMKIQAKETEPLINYLKANKCITDVLITGGDPMVMNSRILESYIDTLLEVDSIETIRIGTKSLSFWPHKFVDEEDADKLLAVLKKVVDAGKHLAIMAHFNHGVELSSSLVATAILNLKKIGAEIRTQGPLLKSINNSSNVWADMWKKQVQLGCVPYYMFLPRDTGAQHYFAETLPNALKIYREAIQQVSGLARTARGPVMSVVTGKVEVLDIKNDVYYLRYLQHRSPEETYKIFLGKSKVEAPTWFSDLEYINEEDAHLFI
ncbi:KamA family radical SAM protein [Chitinophaga agri]|uniref:Lysine 2,3-aminomutase n=1 Tax=Chitinophaga agri TaxID=2703787 RepID=A0A6B9ZLV0_9BACT|nr:lysine 2,3-aminomutase [Chitinophaga agri]QHS63372.1 lysine 2,3-aminomutase [Chitinophaga agri]